MREGPKSSRFRKPRPRKTVTAASPPDGLSHSELIFLDNVFASLDIPIIILGRDYSIRRFTPAAEYLFHLAPSDIGRPIGGLQFAAIYAGVRNEIAAATLNGVHHECQIRGPDGRWLSLRIHPYRSAENEISGAMLIFVDVHDLRQASDLIQEQRQYSEAIIAALRESLLVLDSNFRILTANNSFLATFNFSSPQIVGRHIFEIGSGEWKVPHLHQLLQDVLSLDAEFSDFEMDHVFTNVGRKMLLLNARRFLRRSDGSPLILLAIQDETLHRHAQHMSAQLLRIQDEERRRFASELHDSTSQSLAALTMNMKRLMEDVPSFDSDLRAIVNESQELAQSSIREIRTVTYMLHPPLLQEAGLASAIRTYAAGFSKRSGIRIDLNILDQIPPLTNDMDLALFRICQECLNNIHRHSGSASASIKLEATSDELILTVSDKGKGLGSDLVIQNGKPIGGFGVGIPSMQERTRQLRGTLDIDSSPAGTSIRAIIPLQQS